jgi:hypothetical protein
MRLVHNRQCSLFDGDAEEWNMEDIVRLMPSAEEGVSLGSGGHTRTSGSGRI